MVQSDDPKSETAASRVGDAAIARFILPLTGIRGLAALWVLFYHLRNAMAQVVPSWETFLGLIAHGYLGVDLFAFLSGFVISHTYGDRLARFSAGDAGRYLWARLARIYPLHLFILILFVVSGVWLQGAESLSRVVVDERLWRQLLLIHGWGLEDRFGWNAPSWTVSSEWFCYLCFPFVAPFLSRLRRGSAAAGLAVVVLGATTAAMFAVGHPAFDAFLDFGLVRIGGEFLVGCLLYRAYRDGFGRELPWGWIGLLALIGGLGLSKILPVVSVACFAVLVYALAHDHAPLRSIFANRPAVWLGEISYSIYMLHWFVLTRGVSLMGEGAEQMPPRVLAALLVAMVIGGSALTYTLVERPARRRLRGVFDLRRPGRPRP